MIDTNFLKNDEKSVFALRSLYRKYGYLPFKMSKFEEYDLYLKNKDFLVSDRVITFNDTNGKLMALKPDVTLSIIKSSEDTPGCKQKLCYNENVYRVSGSTHQYKEIMQTGLECIGDIDSYDTFEVISLAAKSLALISPDYVLNISHVGVVALMLDRIGDDASLRSKLLKCLSEKNTHDLTRLCSENNVESSVIDLLCKLTGLSCNLDSLENELSSIISGNACDELYELAGMLKSCDFASHIRFDFSIINDMNYYNGIVFKGYLNGICEGVLSGGRYDKLMQRMGRHSGALGFAIYLDLLENLTNSGDGYDVDILLLYSDSTPASFVAEKVSEAIESGKSISSQKAIPEKLRYRTLTDIRGKIK
jgi:ATP phosphoribosyltransferase regulatory subunit